MEKNRSSKDKMNTDNTLVIVSNNARNRWHFTPIIDCQLNLIFKMVDKNHRSQGKRVPDDSLNNVSSADLFYIEKSKKKHLQRAF